MAETEKARSGIRIKSSERKEEEARKSQDEELDQAKGNLAWKILSEEQILTLKELTVHEHEAKLAEILSIEDHHISLPEACVLDYYVAGFWFAKEEKFTNQQISAFFTLLKIMLDNIKKEKLSLVESIKVFKSLMAGVGVEHSPKSGGLECFDVNQAKSITDYFSDSLFQHYKLYQFLFTQDPQEEIISTKLIVEVPPFADCPFPPPLDEGMTEEMWKTHIMTPAPSPVPGSAIEEDEIETSKAPVDLADEEKAGDILVSVNPDDVKKVVKIVADEILGNFKTQMDSKLKDRETMFISKFNKQNPR